MNSFPLNGTGTRNETFEFHKTPYEHAVPTFSVIIISGNGEQSSTSPDEFTGRRTRDKQTRVAQCKPSSDLHPPPLGVGIRIPRQTNADLRNGRQTVAGVDSARCEVSHLSATTKTAAPIGRGTVGRLRGRKLGSPNEKQVSYIRCLDRRPHCIMLD